LKQRELEHFASFIGGISVHWSPLISYISHLFVAIEAFIWPPATTKTCYSFDSEHPKADLAQCIGDLKDISCDKVTYLTVENTLEL
jgi:hypothetical protein